MNKLSNSFKEGPIELGAVWLLETHLAYCLVLLQLNRESKRLILRPWIFKVLESKLGSLIFLLIMSISSYLCLEVRFNENIFELLTQTLNCLNVFLTFELLLSKLDNSL